MVTSQPAHPLRPGQEFQEIALGMRATVCCNVNWMEVKILDEMSSKAPGRRRAGPGRAKAMAARFTYTDQHRRGELEYSSCVVPLRALPAFVNEGLSP